MKKSEWKSAACRYLYSSIIMVVSIMLWIGVVWLLNPITSGNGMIITNVIGLGFAIWSRNRYDCTSDMGTHYLGSAILGLTIPIMYGLIHLTTKIWKWIEEE